MVSDSIQTKIVEMVEEHGNRMRIEEAANELNERIGTITYDETKAEQDIRQSIKERKELVKDRFGGHDQIEKVVY